VSLARVTRARFCVDRDTRPQRLRTGVCVPASKNGLTVTVLNLTRTAYARGFAMPNVAQMLSCPDLNLTRIARAGLFLIDWSMRG
jgi:hypothetical protein